MFPKHQTRAANPSNLGTWQPKAHTCLGLNVVSLIPLAPRCYKKRVRGRVCENRRTLARGTSEHDVTKDDMLEVAPIPNEYIALGNYRWPLESYLLDRLLA